MRIPEPFYRLTGQLQRRYLQQWLEGKRDCTLPWNWDNNAIFLHIPKTAGTSLLNALGAERHPHFLTHVPAEAYQRLVPELWDRAFKFTFVRDPQDRLASTFFFLRDGTNWPDQIRWADKKLRGMEFPEFLESLRTRFAYRQSVLSEPFFWPQSDYLRSGRGYVTLDAIYRFEELNSGAKEVSERLGRTWDSLPHDRKLQRPKSADLYDAKAARMVGRLYAKDYKMFGYARPS